MVNFYFLGTLGRNEASSQDMFTKSIVHLDTAKT